MDYKACAKQIIEKIGGKENIISAAHCATRLRLVISDNSKCNKEALENIDGVKGVFEASGQLQIIIGTGTVNKVYDEFIKEADIEAASKEDVKLKAANKMPWYKKAIKTLGDVFVPIIPAIVASGLLMGLLEGLAKVFPTITASGTYTIIHLFSNAAFVFLPVLIATSAAKVFGGNMFLGAVIGMIMIHPDLVNAWNVATTANIPTAEAWFGLYNIDLVGYQGHVIPVIIAVWIMCVIEKFLHKKVPAVIDLFVTPLVSVLVTGYLTLTVIGPVFGRLENYVLVGVQWLISIPFGIGAALCGAIYAPTVVAGVHHMYNALEAGLLSSTGYNTWMPIATAANVAQGAAALAFSIKTKSKKQKAVALPASLSAFLGITEPAIFGVNLRFVKPFLAGIIGGAAGAAVAGLLKVSATAYGITGIFGILITTHNLLAYLLVMAVAFAVAFLFTMILYKDKKGEALAADGPSQEDESSEAFVETTAINPTVYSPLNGTTVPLADVPDATFAEGILGSGIAIEPSDGTVYAPGDGVISTLFDTHHAIGLQLDNGAEILVHIGINTVELDGEGYMALVNEGDRVKLGDKLITFDRELIESKGYKIITPVIVTNTDDYVSVTAVSEGAISAGDALLNVSKEAQS